MLIVKVALVDVELHTEIFVTTVVVELLGTVYSVVLDVAAAVLASTFGVEVAIS